MNTNSKNVLVLFSGGIDSTACIHYYKQLGYNVEGLFINYQQASYTKEKEAVDRISSFYKISTVEVFVTSIHNISSGFILGRNNLFISIALLNFKYHNGLISLGIHSGTNYPDCDEKFKDISQQMLNHYTNGQIIIDCPFIKLNKREIFEYCLINKLPLELTYSCENGAKQPCNNCESCKDLIKFLQYEY